jgi:NAD(P)-dependent dehydrogenase (short-subunit alcohol dehydrogenase family)
MAVSIVTGCTRGIGRGTLLSLARDGDIVIGIGRNPKKLESILAEVKANGGVGSVFAADVCDELALKNIATAIKKQYGKVDRLINNAGVFMEPFDWTAKGPSSVLNVSSETFRKTWETNVLGAFLCIQAFVPLMGDSGTVVNVSSGMGQLSEMGGLFPAYRSSKTALNALTKLLSQELAHTGIRVNSVCPGWVKTDMGGTGADRELDQGVESVKWAAYLKADGPTGGFFRDGKPLTW